MVRWTVTRGHHALLRRLIATDDAAVSILHHQPAKGKDHPSWWAVWSGSEPTVELVTRHAGVVPATITRAFLLGSPVAVVDILVHRLLGAAAATKGEADASLWRVEQLDEVLSQTRASRSERVARSSSELLLIAAEAGHTDLMAFLLGRGTQATRQQLLQATNYKGNTGTCTAKPTTLNVSVIMTVRYGVMFVSMQRPAFLEACDSRHSGVFALLLPMLSVEQVRETTGFGTMSALGLAVRRGDVAMVRTLLDHGALANGNSKESAIPLCTAVTVPQHDTTHTTKECTSKELLLVGHRRKPTGGSWWTCSWNVGPTSTRATDTTAGPACMPPVGHHSSTAG
jgi:hypothetical protein